MPRFPPGGEEHRRGRATLAARAACTTGDGHGSISAAALCGTLGLPWVCDGDLIFPRGNSMKFSNTLFVRFHVELQMDDQRLLLRTYFSNISIFCVYNIYIYTSSFIYKLNQRCTVVKC